MSKRNKELEDAVAALRPEMIAALQRLIRKPSVEASPLPGKPFGPDVDACFTEALTLCHELGFETTDLDRYIGWCEIGSGDEMVAVLGHLDVVPEGEGWHHPPYGEYPLINGEKGILNEWYGISLRQDGKLQIKSVRGGVAGNVVPAHAEAELTGPACISLPEAEGITVTRTEGGWKVEAEGVSAHGSHPEQGKNAIGLLMLYLNRLPLTGSTRRVVSFLAEKFGLDPYGARLLGKRLEDDLSGPMSCNLGLIEGDSGSIRVKLNYRYPVTKTVEDCQPAVKAAFENAGWKLEQSVHKEKLYYPETAPLVKALLETYRTATADHAPPKCIGGGTYAKVLPNTVAFGPLFEGDPVTEHQPDEFIDLDRLVQNAQIIAQAMVKLANLPLE